jgi:hypothetical protein
MDHAEFQRKTLLGKWQAESKGVPVDANTGSRVLHGNQTHSTFWTNTSTVVVIIWNNWGLSD